LTSELIWVLTLLLAAMVLFASNKLRMDVVALLVIVAFVMSGTLTLNEAMAGFSDPNVILIAALFVVGHGLVRTGVAYQVGEWLMKVAGNSETRMLVLLMITVAGLGAFMSSTGVVAIFIPVVLSVSAKMKTAPARLMMPLSFAGLISGMMTLVATPPNMVVNSELLREGFDGFGFFGVTPVGLVVLSMGVVYMLVARRWLSSENGNEKKETWQRRTFRDLIRDYRLTGRARRMAIRPGSPLVGKTLDDLHLRSRYGANVVGIERWRKFRRVMVSATGSTELRARDVLLLDMSDSEVSIRQFCVEEQLEPMVLRGEYFSEQSRDVGMAEVSLIPDSELLGKSLRQVGFRSRYGLNVVGIRRQAEALEGKLVDEELQLGDMLLVIGDWKLIRQLQQQMHDFIVLSQPGSACTVLPDVNGGADAYRRSAQRDRRDCCLSADGEIPLYHDGRGV
jgi:di/tricarboxylate transporter